MSAEFEDGKDEGALRTIGEVSKALGIKTHVLRYWEQQFPMLEPLKRSGGRRYYRTEDVELVETIDRLVNQEGYTLKGAKKAIKDGTVDRSSESEALTEPSADPTDIEGTSHLTTESSAFPPFAAPPIESVPEDGGVGDFFGKAAAEANEAEEAQAATVDCATEHPLPRAEILSRLKQIRANLAEAITA